MLRRRLREPGLTYVVRICLDWRLAGQTRSVANPGHINR